MGTRLISIDTEDTGVDFWHGARPFYVTTHDDSGKGAYWEWDVDPETREVSVPDEDVEEVRALIAGADRIVGQNLKFDAHALHFLGVEVPWGKVEDTLVAGHVLASNRPHNLTDMAIQYLGVDVEPLELALKAACDEARRWCRSNEPGWAIAKQGRPDMPSAKEKCWKYDTWLPRAVVKHQWETSEAWTVYVARRLLNKVEVSERCSKLPGWDLRPPDVEDGGDPRWTVLRDYANADSEVTLALWQVMEAELRRRNLWRIYRERMKVVPIAMRMEQRGVTVSGARLKSLVGRYKQDSARAEQVCVGIAESAGFALEVPKGGNNKSLRTFLFDVLRLPRVKCSEKTGEPSLDKAVMDEYEHVLPPRSPGLAFVKALKGKRKRDTAVSYMEGYARFWKRLRTAGGDWCVLHPNLNVTGTDTLRMSSANPNAQNISKQDSLCQRCLGDGCGDCDGSGRDLWSLRYCFGPAPGREWWSLDAKNIELRLPAYLSGEDELIALFERPDDPPYYGSQHLLNFHTVYPDVWEAAVREVGADKAGPHCKKKHAATWYQWCKNGDFAIQYGAQRAKADATFRRDGSFDRLESRFAKQKRMVRDTIAFAERHGYVETIPDRTVDPERGYPLLCTRTEYGKVLPTVPWSYKIQGSAMQWTARAMVKCDVQLDAWERQVGFSGRIALQVHDELVFDFPKVGDPVAEHRGEAPSGSSNLWRIRVIQRLMESCGEDFVPRIPTPVGLSYHADNWSESVEL